MERVALLTAAGISRDTMAMRVYSQNTSRMNERPPPPLSYRLERSTTCVAEWRYLGCRGNTCLSSDEMSPLRISVADASVDMTTGEGYLKGVPKPFR